METPRRLLTYSLGFRGDGGQDLEAGTNASRGDEPGTALLGDKPLRDAACSCNLDLNWKKETEYKLNQERFFRQGLLKSMRKL